MVRSRILRAALLGAAGIAMLVLSGCSVHGPHFGFHAHGHHHHGGHRGHCR
jgi:hypothetical protein